MAGKTVRQRSGICRQEIQRDALERRAVRARLDVGGCTGWAAFAKSFVGAIRLRVSRGRSHPRDAVGNGRWRLGKRRACGGGGAAKDRRAQGYRTRGGASARSEATAPNSGSADQLKQPQPKALISWSSGKDSAFALHEIRRAGEFDVVGALTTVTETFDRVSIHGVRQELLRAQMNEPGLPPHIVAMPYPVANHA